MDTAAGATYSASGGQANTSDLLPQQRQTQHRPVILPSQPILIPAPGTHQQQQILMAQQRARLQFVQQARNVQQTYSHNPPLVQMQRQPNSSVLPRFHAVQQQPNLQVSTQFPLAPHPPPNPQILLPHHQQLAGLLSQQLALNQQHMTSFRYQARFGRQSGAPRPRKRAKYTASHHRRDEKPFPFLALPAEIRNQIYRECLLGLPIVNADMGTNYVSNRAEDLSQGGEEDHQEPKTFVCLLSKPSSYRRVSKLCDMYDALLMPNPALTPNLEVPMSDSPDSRSRFSSWYEPPKPAYALLPELLRVNKQIHAESCSMLYSQHFIFVDLVALFHFVDAISPEVADRIFHIQVKQWTGNAPHTDMASYISSLLAAKGFRNLKSFRVDFALGCSNPRNHGSGIDRARALGNSVARKLFKDMYPWLMSFGRAKGDSLAALDVVKVPETSFRVSLLPMDYTVNHEAVQFYRDEIRRLLLKAQ